MRQITNKNKPQRPLHRKIGNGRKPDRKLQSKNKNRRKTPGMYTMIFYWILAMFLVAAVFFRALHFISKH